MPRGTAYNVPQTHVKVKHKNFTLKFKQSTSTLSFLWMWTISKYIIQMRSISFPNYYKQILNLRLVLDLASYTYKVSMDLFSACSMCTTTTCPSLAAWGDPSLYSRGTQTMLTSKVLVEDLLVWDSLVTLFYSSLQPSL